MAYRDLVIAHGASHYWKLDETSGTVAVDQIGGANGTISGGVTLNQPGQVGKAMTFDGTTAQIQTAQVVASALPYTAEAWIRTTATTERSWFTGADGVTAYGAITPGGALFSYWGAGSGAGIRLVNDGRWHHVVVVWRSTGVTFYVDGILDVDRAATAPPAMNQTAQIGCRTAGSPANTWLGQIDEVAIYPLALTPTQIAAHAAAGKAGWPGVPWWTDFDEDDMNNPYNLYEPITPSDGADLKRGLTLGIWVGGGGDVAAVTQSGVATVFAAVPAGAWLPLAARRINATGTTATGLVGLYRV